MVRTVEYPSGGVGALMPLYLSPYIGTGVHDDPYRPVGQDTPGASTIDIRLDPTRADGDGIGYALLWVSAGIPDPKGAIKIADDYGERVSASIKTNVNTRLGLDFSRDATIQDIVETVLLRPDTGKWHALRPKNGRLEAWLGSSTGKQRWINNPVLAGGTITDNFNRSNETPIASPWAQQSGSASTINLSGNAITHASTGDTYYYYSNGSGWNADQSSQFLLATAVTSGDFGPAVRIGVSGVSGYFYSNYSASSFRGPAKHVSGSYSIIESGYASVSAGQTIKIDVVGSTIRCYANGAEDALSPATDTSLATAGNGAGVFIYETGGSLDDFTATGEIAAGGTNPKGPLGNPLFGPFGGPI